ncbi:6-hydroxymethylpterin diphosphokinase MptE-like protein [Geoalkalibacter halelectricus]|uniref:motility associated factor glycosyltransferase family protein n=1 Tax=Geoalkalibacter halelectricus TaxID=2847045 RepID=UPI003D23534B
MSTPGTDSLGPFITNRFGDRYLYEVNRNAFNQVGSEAVYQKYFGEELFRSNRLFIIVGTDSGVLLRYLQKRSLPEGSRYLLVELPGVIEALREVGGLDDLPERVRVVSLEELWPQAEAFQLQNYLYLSAVELRDSIAAMDANLMEYRDLSDHLREQIHALDWATRGGLGCRDFVVRQLENLGENRIPAIHLKGKFAGKTAVILGGGPSLDELLPWVRDHQGEVAIFAVSRISRRLLEFGLAPHLIFSVDPHDVSFDVSREMLNFWEQSLFVHSYHVNPKLLGQWRGLSVYVGERYPWTTDGNPQNLSSAGPTVTNTAISVAIEMGFSQIILGGVDLCYSKTGMTHASGSFESAIGPRLNSVLTVETNGGWRAETGPDYFKAIEVLDQQAAHAKRLGCRVVNPAPGAARLTNVVFLPLEKLELPQLEKPFLSMAFECLPEETNFSRIVHYDEVHEELERVKGILTKIKDLAGEGLYCNKRLFGKAGKKADFQFKKRMDEIEKRLNGEFSDLTPLVKKFGIQEFLKVTRLEADKDWTDEEIEKTADVYYGAFRNSAERLLAIVEQAISRIEARKLEEQPGAEIEKLSEIWRSDGQPGRGLVWFDRRPEQKGISRDQEKLIAALTEEFESALNSSGAFTSEAINAAKSLAPARAKALRLFRSKDKEGLLRMANGLDKHQDQEHAEPLCALIRGYLAELENNSDVALANYQVLIGESFEPSTEDALKRIASLGLQTGQVEFAKLALECLANAVFVYKPQYAELLRALGQHQAAADAYVDYLDHVPSDIGVLLKLGQLYQTMGAEDAARQVFEIVLAKEPENSAALSLLLGESGQC